MGLFKRKSIKISIIQMNILQDDKDVNLTTASRLIDECAFQGTGIIVLPQAFATSINLPSLHQMAEPVPDGKIISFLSKKAVTHKTYIIAGILEKEDSNVYDSAVVISPDGQLIGKYRRWFLWGMEKDFMAPGKPGKCIHTELGKIGLLLGYDIGFPEACRSYFKEKVDILICMAAIFEDISYPMEYLCRARTMENHCYFVFASGLGYHMFGNTYYMGKSLIACDPLFLVFELKQKAEPNFDIIGQLGKKEGILTRELFIEDLKKRVDKTPQYQDLEYAMSGIERERI